MVPLDSYLYVQLVLKNTGVRDTDAYLQQMQLKIVYNFWLPQKLN